MSAMINAMATRSCPKCPAKIDYVSERCDTNEYAKWEAFIPAAAQNVRRRWMSVTGVPAADIRAVPRASTPPAGNGTIYYGLGVTEHCSRWLHDGDGHRELFRPMLTGNIGREGVGGTAARPEQRAGLSTHGLVPPRVSGYRHVSTTAVRELFEDAWGVPLQKEPGLRIPNMFEAAIDGSFKGLYVQGEDIAQSDPNTQHVTAALTSIECLVVQDIFMNETARFAHVFLPGASFLEKAGTFTNAERRISRVRKAMPPLSGQGRLRKSTVMPLSNALVLSDGTTSIRSEIMDEIARLTPTFKGVSYARIDELGSIQWPCNDAAPEGTPTMHIGKFVRGKGRFIVTEYVATEEKVNSRFPLILTTGRILSQYNVGAQTRRTANNTWHAEDRMEIHPHDAQERGIKEGDWVGIASRAGETVQRATITDNVQPGVVYTTFHFPESGANVITTDNSDWATNCPSTR